MDNESLYAKMIALFLPFNERKVFFNDLDLQTKIDLVSAFVKINGESPQLALARYNIINPEIVFKKEGENFKISFLIKMPPAPLFDLFDIDE